MLETLNKLGKPIGNIILNGEKTESAILRSETKESLLLPYLFNTELEGLLRTITWQKERKSIKIKKEEIKTISILRRHKPIFRIS